MQTTEALISELSEYFVGLIEYKICFLNFPVRAVPMSRDNLNSVLGLILQFAKIQYTDY